MPLFSQGEGVHAGRRQGVHPPQVRQLRGDGVQLHVAHLPPEDEDQQREWAGSGEGEGGVNDRACNGPWFASVFPLFPPLNGGCRAMRSG